MTNPLRVGLIGYGFASATFHAPLIHAVPGLELVAVSTRDPHKVKADWPTLDTVASPEALLARTDLDVVVIPTPNDSHHPWAAAALAAGKHVVVDKPFTVTSAEASDLIQRAKQADRLLSVFHNRRWDADFLALQAVIASGQLGRITHVESHFDRFRPVVRDRWREGTQAGGGLWYDLGPHLLDQALCLWGQPDAITLDLAIQRDQGRADDWFHAVLRYGPMRVILHASTLVADLGPRWVVHGTRGSFVKYGLDAQEDQLRDKLSCLDPQWGKDPRPGQITLNPSGDQAITHTFDSPAGCYTRYYEQVRDAILTGAPNPVPAEQALQVMKGIEAGLASYRLGQVIQLEH